MSERYPPKADGEQAMGAEHTDVGAYALGLLEDADRRAFEDHLAGCPSCTAELAELSPMGDLLAGIEPAPADDGPSQAQITSLVERRARSQRHRLRWQGGLAAAASVALLAGGTAAGLAVASGSGGPAVLTQVAGARHSATDAGTGVHGTVGLVAKPWGTQVTLALAKIHGPLKCQLIAVSTTGKRLVVSGWLVPAAGYGVPGHPADLLVAGGTWLHPSQIARFDVIVTSGRTLVSIPA